MTDPAYKSVLYIDINNRGQDFVCGDIHGCFDELEEELKKIGFNKLHDRLFSVGDLIDRGPKSELALDYLAYDWFFSVMGNHEHMFLLAGIESPEQDEDLFNHLNNGGDWAYDMNREKYIAMQNAVKKMPLIIKVGDVIITHAALPSVKNLSQIENNPNKYSDTILWHRGEYPPVKLFGVKKVYVGHTIVKKPLINGKYINIDTGIVGKYFDIQGKLTVLEI